MKPIKYCMGNYFAAFIVIACIMTTVSITINFSDIINKSGDVTTSTLLHGKFISKMEKEIEDNLIVKDAAVALWGMVNYGLFNSGSTGVVIGTNGMLFTDEEFKFYKNGAEEEHKKLNIIHTVNDFLATKDIRLIIAIVPSKATIYSENLGNNPIPSYNKETYERFRKKILAMNIPSPDLKAAFLQEKETTPIFLRLDTHWTPQGANIAAQAIAEIAGEVTPKKAFKLEHGTETRHDGDLESYLPLGWLKEFLAPSSERYTPYNMYAVEESNDLFGDPEIPVVLVGTSYSASPKWNFDGLLKNAFQADVVNAAIEGRGPMKPMADYLNAKAFDNGTTQIVIWEIPERFIPTPYDDVTFPSFLTEDVE